MRINAYFDGCCEPVNPGGVASFGAVVFKGLDRVHDITKLFVPIKGRERETSNNVAEYSGFLSLLEYFIEQGWQKEDITVFGDSRLVIYQMFGDPNKKNKKWQMKKGFYIPIAEKAQKLLRKFSNLKGEWIPREENDIADELSKAELLKAGVEFRIQPNDKQSQPIISAGG